MTDKPGLPDGQEFYKLNEVCKLANVQPYMLRFWGSEFTELEASRTDTGQRLYTRDQVEVILEIRRLLFDEGLTIAGTRKRINALREGGKGGAKRPAKPAAADEAPATTAAPGADLTWHPPKEAAEALAALAAVALPLLEPEQPAAAVALPLAEAATPVARVAVESIAAASTEVPATFHAPSPQVAPEVEVDKRASDRVQPLLAALTEVRSEVSRIVAEIRQTAGDQP